MLCIFDKLIIFSEQKRSKFEQSDNEEAPGSFGPSDNDHDEYIEDSPERSPPIIAPDLPPYYPAIQGCRNVEEFNCLNRIEEGTYGVVFRALDKKTSESYTIYHLWNNNELKGKFNGKANNFILNSMP